MSKKISIGIVDDDVDFLNAMTKILCSKEDLEVVFKASNRNDAIKYAKSYKPQIILMDIDLKDKDYTGIEITREILENNPDQKVIMLTGMEESNLVIESARAGAVKYKSKNQICKIPGLFAEEIKLIAEEFNPYSIITGEMMRKEKESKFKSLTVREQQIYELILKNMNKKEIAKNLYLEENTVKNNITSILRKLDAKNCKDVIKKYENF